MVTKGNHSLYVLDTRSKAIVHRDSIGRELYSCVLTPDRKNLLITHGGNELVIWNTEQRRVSNRIPVGDNPNDLIINKKGTLAYIACADDNTVNIVDLQLGKVIETLAATLYPNLLTGSTTNGVALSPDEKTLYVANADNNCLAVFDVSERRNSRSKGFIPTGWYPTCVKTVGKTIFVANGKGFSSFPNPNGRSPVSKKTKCRLSKSRFCCDCQN